MQGAYLGGIFWATHHGLPAALTASITGLQPLMTAAQVAGMAVAALGVWVASRG